jgi:hypothetical protein
MHYDNLLRTTKTQLNVHFREPLTNMHVYVIHFSAGVEKPVFSLQLKNSCISAQRGYVTVHGTFFFKR